MRSKEISIGLTAVMAMLAVTTFVASTPVAAQTETVLFSFSGTNGLSPTGGLVFDAAGNLYGTTDDGGANGYGMVFELTPKAGGGWSEKVLHSFGHGEDGQSPGCTLVMDAAGDLYGTTVGGGSYGGAIAFELSPSASGPWTEKLLHAFGKGKDGINPEAGLIFDAAGNLYGTTYFGGADAVGMVFELMPQTGGGWAEKVVHNFEDNGRDGFSSSTGLTFDAAGNLYGTTAGGGTHGGYGAVFKLIPEAGGGWSEKVLHSFGSGSDGRYLPSSVILDAAGNLYGTTAGGGTDNVGIVFELTPTTSGPWDETILHDFLNNDEDGVDPIGGLIFDAAGNLYGTTTAGGIHGAGTLFEMTPTTGGSWTEQVLYVFKSENTYSGPEDALIFDGAGNLYGTEVGGGTADEGTVFEVTP